ncbi:hypothetical protein N7454_001422 [Penicillium verhagenii]|nr:hypothetical protein N7454_001422 [Penicillium verhagenii]
MSGAEVLAVVACVAAIVSAYRDGSELYQSMKKKWDRRHPKEKSSSNDLERSLIRGQEEILTHWNAHVSRLGRRYEEGDTISREQMKDIVITLQGMLLTYLSRAVDNGATLDVMGVLLASDHGRSRTISVLHDLYQRIAQSTPMQWPVGGGGAVYATVDPASSIGYYIQLLDQGRSLSQSREATWLGGFPATPAMAFPAQLSGQPTNMAGLCRHGELSNAPQGEKKSSGFVTAINSLLGHRSKRESADRSSDGSMAKLDHTACPDVSAHRRASPKMMVTAEHHDTADRKSRPKPPVKRKSHRNLSEMDEITDSMTRQLKWNPWTNDGRSECGRDSDTDLSDGEVSPTTEEPPRLGKREDPDRLENQIPPTLAPPPASVISDHTTHSSTPTIHLRRLSRGQYWPPSKANKYSGFCKGAWKLSSGLGGFKIHSEPVGYYFLMPKWRCYRCYFGMPLAPRAGSDRRDLRFDQKIYLDKSTGIRYRWPFLAKSHVPYTRPGAAASTHINGTFGCIFCCAELDIVAPTMNSFDEFMAHLGEQHRSVDSALLERTRCVVGRVALDEEDFDINIPPARVVTLE